MSLASWWATCSVFSRSSISAIVASAVAARERARVSLCARLCSPVATLAAARRSASGRRLSSRQRGSRLCLSPLGALDPPLEHLQPVDRLLPRALGICRLGLRLRVQPSGLYHALGRFRDAACDVLVHSVRSAGVSGAGSMGP
eukprot:2010139-Prymnesium_polylepis.1